MKPDSVDFLDNLADAMEWDDVDLTLETRFKQLEQWDSMSFLSLLTVLRNDYALSLDVQAFNSIETFQDIYSLIGE